MKGKFAKASPKYVHYCNDQDFNEQDFKLELRGNLEVDVVDTNFEAFHNVYLNVLNKHFCSRLCKKERKKFLDKLDIKLVTDNKTFWTTIKPFLGHKISKSSKIILVEGDEIISADKDIARKFDRVYKNAVSSLKIQCEFVNKCDGLEDPVEIQFKFHKINLDDILKELNNLEKTKNGTFGDIRSKCLKLSSNEIGLHLLHIRNHQIIDQNISQSLLKLADVNLSLRRMAQNRLKVIDL